MAGTPWTRASAATSRMATAPAATVAPVPMLIPLTTTQPMPRNAPVPTSEFPPTLMPGLEWRSHRSSCGARRVRLARGSRARRFRRRLQPLLVAQSWHSTSPLRNGPHERLGEPHPQPTSLHPPATASSPSGHRPSRGLPGLSEAAPRGPRLGCREPQTQPARDSEARSAR